jgi:hypothetical protein
VEEREEIWKAEHGTLIGHIVDRENENNNEPGWKRWFGQSGKASRARVRRDSEGYVVRTLTFDEREQMVQDALDAEDDVENATDQ